MNYQIKWLPETLRSFTADLDTFDPAEQRKIMKALDGVDRLLLDSPMFVGESRAVNSDRILFHPPIFVEYRVEMRLSTVWNVQARILRKRET